MFYDKFAALCKRKGISPSRAAVEAGLSKSLVTKWKVHSVDVPSAEVLKKLSDYFMIPVSELLGEETKNAPAEESKCVTDDDIKFALFGGGGEITDEMYEEVRNFAAFVKAREAHKKEK